ncbi:MAG: PIG-L family deacetylase [Myxococcales bacterium]|nr:PIG-L family deacetylase [Myxococcales bacterium]
MSLRVVKPTLRKHAERLAVKIARNLPGRPALRSLLLARWQRRLVPFDLHELAQTTLVVAPHPDDETLGCGGTIALKRRHGARVVVVVLTDGARSHTRTTPAAEMKRRRGHECEDATSTLGVPARDVIQLDFPDGALWSHRAEASRRLGAVIADLAPTQIFLPHADEPPVDHRAAHDVGLAALTSAQLARSPAVFAYPVWLWWQWPWVSLSADEATGHEILLASWRSRLGTTWLRTFDRAVLTDEVLEVKRAALGAYVSQMTQPAGAHDWPTLGAVSDGTFLQCFFERCEPFATLSPGASGKPWGALAASASIVL